MTAQNVGQLTPEQRREVLGLIRRATRTDGVSPLSEQVLLAVRGARRSRSPESAGVGAVADSSRRPHFLVYSGGQLAGYAHLAQGVDEGAATAEVVVGPERRRRGIGTALIHTLQDAVADTAGSPGTSLRLWSHGDLDGARALAVRHGYANVRELWQMRRSLHPGSASLPGVRLPDGFLVRHFMVGQDEQAWLGVNARAFLEHPEQGRITRYDLDQRIAEPWFDPEGFILIEDARGPAPVLAASHWTKVVPAGGPPGHPGVMPTEGEVYVVGVDPAYQGMGLGRSVTTLGLAHLRAKGLAQAMLYVDADNLAAVTTYLRLDFERSAVDIMYSRISHRTM